MNPIAKRFLRRNKQTMGMVEAMASYRPGEATTLVADLFKFTGDEKVIEHGGERYRLDVYGTTNVPFIRDWGMEFVVRESDDASCLAKHAHELVLDRRGQKDLSPPQFGTGPGLSTVLKLAGLVVGALVLTPFMLAVAPFIWLWAQIDKARKFDEVENNARHWQEVALETKQHLQFAESEREADNIEAEKRYVKLHGMWLDAVCQADATELEWDRFCDDNGTSKVLDDFEEDRRRNRIH